VSWVQSVSTPIFIPINIRSAFYHFEDPHIRILLVTSFNLNQLFTKSHVQVTISQHFCIYVNAVVAAIKLIILITLVAIRLVLLILIIIIIIMFESTEKLVLYQFLRGAGGYN